MNEKLYNIVQNEFTKRVVLDIIIQNGRFIRAKNRKGAER